VLNVKCYVSTDFELAKNTCKCNNFESVESKLQEEDGNINVQLYIFLQ